MPGTSGTNGALSRRKLRRYTIHEADRIPLTCRLLFIEPNVSIGTYFVLRNLGGCDVTNHCRSLISIFILQLCSCKIAGVFVLPVKKVSSDLVRCRWSSWRDVKWCRVTVYHQRNTFEAQKQALSFWLGTHWNKNKRDETQFLCKILQQNLDYRIKLVRFDA